VPQEAYGTGGSNSKTLVNLAMLMGKHFNTRKVNKVKLGKEWDILYCPNTRVQYQTGDGGLTSLWDPSVRFTYGGYNYALPMGKRVGGPRIDGDVYPRDVNKLDSKWLTVLKDKAKGGDPLSMMPRGIHPLVMDFVIGGVKGPHGAGINVSYSDGHIRFLNHQELKGGTSGSIDSFQLWHYAMAHP
jgi:prepilin-type processing-associated H-X9-DG protein